MGVVRRCISVVWHHSKDNRAVFNKTRRPVVEVQLSDKCKWCKNQWRKNPPESDLGRRSMLMVTKSSGRRFLEPRISVSASMFNPRMPFPALMSLCQASHTILNRREELVSCLEFL